MSAHGVSPAWEVNALNQKFTFGQPWIFDPIAIISIYLNCDFEIDENDIGIDITQILAECSFQIDEADVGPIDITQILAECSFQVDQNDINQAITTISLTCFTEIN